MDVAELSRNTSLHTPYHTWLLLLRRAWGTVLSLLCWQGDCILLSYIDVDRWLEGDLITDPRVDDQCSTSLLLLEM